MTGVLRIWHPEAIAPHKPVLDISSRCLNILGTIETGVFMAPNSWYHSPGELAYQGYNDDDIFTSRSITVPEFMHGKPFYNISLNDHAYLSRAIKDKNAAYQWLIKEGFNELSIVNMRENEGVRYYSSGLGGSMDQGPSWGNSGVSIFRSFCEPDVIISGSVLTYRYLIGWRSNILGDYLAIYMGAHKITYGVV